MSGSWGRLPIAEASRYLQGDWRFEALPALQDGDSFLAQGRGRSYGDSCINSQASELDTSSLSRFIRFDVEQGILHCEAGITLDEILSVIVPRGWFLPVVPGTRFVTLGGAIANDVHGKNHHHAGSFGCHVRSLTLLRSDGERPVCGESDNHALFAATIGGLGLTGLITSAEISLIPISSNQMICENLPFSNVQEFAALSRDSADWAYSVSWIDTFARNGQVGRGVFTRTRHAEDGSSLVPGRRKPIVSVPVVPPLSMVNKWTVNLFNHCYFAAGKAKKALYRTHYESFLFPLDAIANWNRIYGSQGFYQYQCVVPYENGEHAIETLLQRIHESGDASFLAVLKAFGERQSPGLLSFPRPGFTLALDFPNRGEKTRRLLASFDETVLSAGGAIYPAKDARMPAELFASGYPQVEEFRNQMDTQFSSAFWRRVQV